MFKLVVFEADYADEKDPSYNVRKANEQNSSDG